MAELRARLKQYDSRVLYNQLEMLVVQQNQIKRELNAIQEQEQTLADKPADKKATKKIPAKIGIAVHVQGTFRTEASISASVGRLSGLDSYLRAGG